MNYTISTEPVTREHIGRRVLVKDFGFRMHDLEAATLVDISTNDNGKKFFTVQFYDVSNRYHFEDALLIDEEVENDI